MIEWIDIDINGSEEANKISVSKYPISVAQYDGFISAGGYSQREYWSNQGWSWLRDKNISQPKYWNEPDYKTAEFPVTGISYWEAQAFGKFVNARLPSESEWQYIATNGGKSTFPWGNHRPETFPANSGFFNDGHSAPLKKIDTYSDGISPHGVWDLLGNVSEWCTLEDTTHSDLAVLCGGSRWNPSHFLDSLFRDEVKKEVRDNQTGIRLIKSNQKSPIHFEQTKKSYISIEDTEIRKPFTRPTAAFRQEGIPQNLNEMNWSLRVTGDVQEEIKFSLEQLKSEFPQTELKGLFVCVCRWAENMSATGVRLSDFLDKIKPTIPSEKVNVLQKSMPGDKGKSYVSCLSAQDHDFKNTLLCHSINNLPLTPELGWPLRVISYDTYGYKQVKCLAELHIQDHFINGWWEESCCYDPKGLIQSGSTCLIGPAPKKIELRRKDGRVISDPPQ